MKPTTSNKGRITRIDQAWGPAHREYALRKLEAIVAEDQARFELSRITDVDLASDLAVMEAHARVWFGEDWAALLEIQQSRVQDADEAFDHAKEEYEQRADYEAKGEHHRALSENYAKEAKKTNLVPVELVADQPPPALPVQSLVLPIKLIQAAMIVAAQRDVRYYLNSVFVHAVDGEIRIVSTDGHRLIVSRFEMEKGQALPDWAETGLLIPRDELAQALPMLTKNAIVDKAYGHVPSIVIDYAKGNAAIGLRSANGFAQFRVKPLDGKFPDYAMVMAKNAGSLARDSNEALTASAINAKYLKSVAEVAEKVGASAVHSFVNGDASSAAFFTFDGAPDTVLVVMPIQTKTTGVSDGVARIVGRSGLELSIIALRAHVTRTSNLLLEATCSKDREDLEAKKASLENRIAGLLAATATGPKQLAAPV